MLALPAAKLPVPPLRGNRMTPVLPPLPSSSRHTGRLVPAEGGSLLVRMHSCSTGPQKAQQAGQGVM